MKHVKDHSQLGATIIIFGVGILALCKSDLKISKDFLLLNPIFLHSSSSILGRISIDLGIISGCLGFNCPGNF